MNRQLELDKILNELDTLLGWVSATHPGGRTWYEQVRDMPTYYDKQYLQALSPEKVKVLIALIKDLQRQYIESQINHYNLNHEVKNLAFILKGVVDACSAEKAKMARELSRQTAIADKYRSECHNLLEEHDPIILGSELLQEENRLLQLKVKRSVQWNYAFIAAILTTLMVLFF
jgi:hypothetical protein